MLKIIIKRIYLFNTLLIITMCVVFVISVNSVIENIEAESETQETQLNQFIDKMYGLSESIIIFAEELLENDDHNENSVYYDNLVYDEELGMYVTEYGDEVPENAVSLFGLKEIPTDELAIQEINMALELGSIFSHYQQTFEEIFEVLYISDSGYMAHYPYVDADEYVNNESLEYLPYYTVATPENNPSGEAVWSSAYYDSSDGATLFSLSQPLYYEDQFLGVISINFSLSNFNARFTTQYDCYVVNSYDQILGTNTDNVPKNELVTTFDLFGESCETISSHVNGESGFCFSTGEYITVLDLDTSEYFSAFIIVPISKIFFAAFVKILPLIMLLIIVMMVFITLEKRKKSYAELERVKDELALLTVIDPLTGIYNRRKFAEILERRVDKSSQKNIHLAILDLDNFKKINDELGHDIGDKVLKTFVNIVSLRFDKYESNKTLYARIGGEEFGIVFAGFQDEEIREICEAFRADVEKYDFRIDANVTISMGVSKVLEIDDVDSIFKKADLNLYEAKKAGKNKVVFDI